MNRTDIQKAFKRICEPQYGEKQLRWFSKVATALQKHDPRWRAERVQTLWKDDRSTLKDWEGYSIRQALSILDHLRSKSIDKRLQENQDLREELQEIKNLLRVRDEKLKHVMGLLFS